MEESPLRKSICEKIKQLKSFLQLASSNKHTNLQSFDKQQPCNDFLNLYLSIPSDMSAQDVDYFSNTFYHQGKYSFAFLFVPKLCNFFPISQRLNFLPYQCDDTI